MSDIPQFWRQKRVLSVLLLPLSLLFWGVTSVRRLLYRLGWFKVYHAPVPLIVVGNITVGGNGKTPVVIALTRALQARGYVVAVVSRGYGAAIDGVREVGAGALASVVGDEPLLIKRQTGAVVFVGKHRAQVVQALLAQYPQTQVIVSDDGLQHYALGRSLEWVVMARDLGLANGYLLPAGALREGRGRLATVDKVLLHGNGAFDLAGAQGLEQDNSTVRRLSDDKLMAVAELADKTPLSALTAIARPERFFQTAQGLGLTLEAQKALPDHADIDAVVAADFAEDGYLLITEKDAVKADSWSSGLRARTFVLGHALQLPMALIDEVVAHIEEFTKEIYD